MKTILVSTYAVNPYKGSEDGMGWNFIYQIARYNKVIAITRQNNRPHIEKYMNGKPDALYANITFLYFDLPYWARFWKKGSRGAMLYFYLWQRTLPHFVRKLDLNFDIVHNLNFHTDWTPSFLWKLGKPFVWGPVGHHPAIPARYLQDYSSSYLVKEFFTWMVKRLFWNFSPALSRSVKNASHVFCMNSTVPKVLKIKQTAYTLTPSVATQDFGFDIREKSEKFRLIAAGRLVPLKGFDMTIRAFALFLKSKPQEQRKNCELLIVGSGPELGLYTQMVKTFDIEKEVKFISWMDRDELMSIFKTSSAFVFPSHEGAGMVVAEALSFGLPVICLDNCGPGEFIDKESGFAVSYSDYNQTVVELSEAMQKLAEDKSLLKQMSLKARQRFENHFHWDVRGEEFRKVYLAI